MLRQKQPLVISNESDGVKQHTRPVSMYETREGIKCDTIQSIQVSKNHIIVLIVSLIKNDFKLSCNSI